ncbi:ABC transporter permease [Legionella pneumophila]|uniref:Permease n=1 Tax=Legionella pneumophila subsp. pascullei TaxID=91890 RepID=A0AAX2IRL2_LEGPN|nr:FtsX-like permease family protein [Legionella pneumophila]AMP88333.1 permease [Legionella pneumophila subsp. pascullei]AMP91242.1 permease [Legionella pneumophila subsp. pascullei]AMP94229.1 permease [Legionella pneumophila subsp. pascullei]SQG89006.1 permease [Legionella pneumophila subsp. pascullei]VEH04056.1 permease [Legionella pneumophila subsp. pascullei]
MVTALNKKLWRDVIKLRSQIITIALVVCSGVSVLIASVNTYVSLRNAQQEFYSKYHFADVFASLKRAPDYLEKRITEISGVSRVETRIVKDVVLDLPWMPEPAVGRFISISDKNKPGLNQLFLRQGRWPESNRYDEILVNESFANSHDLKPGDGIIALLNGHRERLKIVGIALSPEYVYAIRGEDLLPDNRHFGIFWMDRKALSTAFGMQGAFNDISIKLAPNASEQFVMAQLERMFHSYGLTIAYSRKDQVSDRFVTNEIKQQKIIATYIPPVFLMVAAFLLNLVTGRLISKEREQIATLKALGYGDLAIAYHYIKIILIIIVIGSLAGVSLGAWFGNLMTELYTEYFRFPKFSYLFSILAALIGILVCLLAALLGTLRAIYQVINLMPAVAMKPPAPIVYRATVIEKIKFFSRLPSSVKMVYRYILRHFLRTMLTCVGIALAMAIVILGLFWQDAIRYLINTQFIMAQREHALVSFNNPVNKIAVAELNKIIGVTSSEGYRIVPARLTYQHRSELSSLFGIAEHAKLKILLDKHLNRMTIPEQGLLISEGLAERLHLAVGDRLDIELLEGNKAKTQLTVQGIINDYVGMFAYIEIKALNRLLNEDRLINAAAITVDTKHVKHLYKKVKEIPKIATITFKTSIIKTFEETFAKHILVFTTILASFAIIIAVSVVYNNASITLAERARELTTLQVLGFTQGEVSTLLFLNHMFEIIISTPLGLITGYLLSWSILQLMQTDWFKIPFVIEAKTYVISIMVIFFSSLISFYIIQRKASHLNLTAVLKVAD